MRTALTFLLLALAYGCSPQPAEDARNICPQCHNASLRPIMYGYPAPEALEMADNEEIILGGCVISGNDPRIGCLKCDYRK